MDVIRADASVSKINGLYNLLRLVFEGGIYNVAYVIVLPMGNICTVSFREIQTGLSHVAKYATYRLFFFQKLEMQIPKKIIILPTLKR